MAPELGAKPLPGQNPVLLPNKVAPIIEAPRTFSMHGESTCPTAISSEQPGSASPQVQFVAQARIPTQYGTFNMKVFQEQALALNTWPW